jgi:hypothetical protein
VRRLAAPGLSQWVSEQFAILYKSFSFERITMPG